RWSGARSFYDLRAAVAHRDDIAPGHERAKAHDRTVTPDFGADGFAGKHRRGKSPAHGGHARGVVAARALEQRVADDTEGAEAVQDRPGKARRLRYVEIGVQRIEIGGEA